MAIDENIRDLKLSARVDASGDTGVGSVGGWGEIEKVGTSCNPITISTHDKHEGRRDHRALPLLVQFALLLHKSRNQ